MHWAKTQRAPATIWPPAAWRPFPLRELPDRSRELEINGENSYGYAPLKRRSRQSTAWIPDCVVTAAGTSMANHLAMAALLEPGDEVLMRASQPTDLIVDARATSAPTVKPFPRRPESGYARRPGRGPPRRHAAKPS